MQISHKVIISYIGIVLITSIIFLYYKNKQVIREGAANPFKEISGFIKKITAAFKEIPIRINNFGKSFATVGKALGLEFTNLGKSSKLFVNDTESVIGTVFTSISDYLKNLFIKYLGPRFECGIQKIKDFNACFKYYFFNLISETLYSIFFGLPIFLIKLGSGFDLEPTFNMIWEGICCIDDFIYGMVGYHFIRWSDEIMDQCFLCKNLTPLPTFPDKPINDQIQKMQTDIHKTIPRLLNEPIKTFKEAGTQFKSVFS